MSSEEISRRRMLKRIGAGAAVAWSAPILTSIRTPAFAQYGGCSPGSSCFACQGCPTPESPHCGGNPDCNTADWCGCVTTPAWRTCSALGRVRTPATAWKTRSALPSAPLGATPRLCSASRLAHRVPQPPRGRGARLHGLSSHARFE
jgi:hypothetical protein